MKKRTIGILILAILLLSVTSCKKGDKSEGQIAKESEATEEVIHFHDSIVDIETQQEDTTVTESEPVEDAVVAESEQIEESVSQQSITPTLSSKPSKAQEIVNSIITSSMSELEKVMAIHDWLTCHVDYNYNAYVNNPIPDADHTALGLFENRIAVCDGYSEAFLLMCEAAGIQAVEVIGTADGVPHAWNQVYIDGAWYNVDVTWDDPITTANKDINDNSNVSYDYFLVSDEQLSRTHTATSGKNICSGTYNRRSVYEAAIESGVHGSNVGYAESREEAINVISGFAGANVANITIWYYHTSAVSQNDATNIADSILQGVQYPCNSNITYSYSDKMIKITGTFMTLNELNSIPKARGEAELSSLINTRFDSGETSFRVVYEYVNNQYALELSGLRYNCQLVSSGQYGDGKYELMTIHKLD